MATLIVHLSKLKCWFLGDSFLVRLMDSIDLYQKSDGRYNSDVITKLTYNYRYHPQILKVPNNLFYDGELVVTFGLKNLLISLNKILSLVVMQISLHLPAICLGCHKKDSPLFFMV
jgi:superfamily I DNA and/or RNA helicase